MARHPATVDFLHASYRTTYPVQNRLGPYALAGNEVWVVRHGDLSPVSGKVIVYRAIDGGYSFVPQDMSNAPTAGKLDKGPLLNSVYMSSKLYIIYLNATGKICLSVFNMSTRLWESHSTSAIDLSGNLAAPFSYWNSTAPQFNPSAVLYPSSDDVADTAFIEIRTTGEVVIVYPYVKTEVAPHGTNYLGMKAVTWNAGVWGTPFVLGHEAAAPPPPTPSPGLEYHKYALPVGTVRGRDNGIYVFWVSELAHLWWQEITSANVVRGGYDISDMAPPSGAEHLLYVNKSSPNWPLSESVATPSYYPTGQLLPNPAGPDAFLIATNVGSQGPVPVLTTYIGNLERPLAFIGALVVEIDKARAANEPPVNRAACLMLEGVPNIIWIDKDGQRVFRGFVRLSDKFWLTEPWYYESPSNPYPNDPDPAKKNRPFGFSFNRGITGRPTFVWSTGTGVTAQKVSYFDYEPIFVQQSTVPNTWVEHLKPACVGEQYTETFLGQNGQAPFTFRPGSGTAPPPGLTLSLSGVLSGTPTTAGSYFFYVVVTDSVGVNAGPRIFYINVGNPEASAGFTKVGLPPLPPIVAGKPPGYSSVWFPVGELQRFQGCGGYGPFASWGSLYTIIVTKHADAANNYYPPNFFFNVYRSDDDGASWTVYDSANSPRYALRGHYDKGRDLFTVLCQTGAPYPDPYVLRNFNPANDTWGAAYASTNISVANYVWQTLTRKNGNTLVIYDFNFIEWNGTAWSAPVSIGSGSFRAAMMDPVSGNIHVIFYDSGNVCHRVIRTNNTLGPVTVLCPFEGVYSSVTEDAMPIAFFGGKVYYFRYDTNLQKYMADVGTPAAEPTAFTTIEVSGAINRPSNTQAVGAAIVSFDGLELHYIYVVDDKAAPGSGDVVAQFHKAKTTDGIVWTRELFFDFWPDSQATDGAVSIGYVGTGKGIDGVGAFAITDGGNKCNVFYMAKLVVVCCCDDGGGAGTGGNYGYTS